MLVLSLILFAAALAVIAFAGARDLSNLREASPDTPESVTPVARGA